jgi:hypothetical protein
VHTQTPNAKSLVLLVLLAVALTWLASGRQGATAAFQSPIPFESELPTPTVEPSPTLAATAATPPTPTAELSPVATQMATETATPVATPEPAQSPTPSGFLPPPTLTSPGTAVPIGPQASLPAELPVRIAPTTPSPENSSSGSQTSSAITLARLIDQAVLAIGYIWLGCGALALMGVAGALIWFVRRSRRG